MRAMGVLALLLVSLLASLPLGGAQEGAAEVSVLQDSEGDVDVLVGGTSGGNPAGHYDYLDLTAATVVETPDSFSFTVHVLDLIQVGDGAADDGGFIDLFFVHHDTEFRVSFGRCMGCFAGSYHFANLYMRPVEGGDWSFLRGSFGGEEVVVDEEESSLQWAVPRDNLLDQNGAPPFPGRVLTGFRATSAHMFNNLYFNDENGDPLLESPYQVVDAMPDDGVGGVDVPILYGIEQSGDARLDAAEPFRASNGEATTFLYEVNARNVGEAEHIFYLETSQVPAQWDVTLPVPNLVLGAGETRTFPVLINTPFGHQHGGVDSLLLSMQSAQDPSSVGRVELGVRYLEVPQPAGHHDTVFFHSRVITENPFAPVFGGAVQAYMNTIEVDDGDAGEPVPALNAGIRPGGGQTAGAVTSTFRWMIPLDPQLRMGLDFDVNGEGELIFPVQSGLPIEDAILSGELLVAIAQEGPGQQVTRADALRVAHFTTEEPVSLGVQDTHTFQTLLAINEEGDVVRYDPAQQLYLYVTLRGTVPQHFLSDETLSPRLAPGGYMTLPLFEYRDPVEGAFSSADRPVLRVVGSKADRFANPGDVLLFDMDLVDRGGADGRYDITITGRNKEWVEVLGPSSVDLGAIDKTRIQVLVQVPDDAVDQEIADLFVEAAHAQDDTKRSLLRLVVEVDEDREHEDDSVRLAEITGGQKDAPAPLAVAFVALVAVAFGRRSGRR